jgi:hypothetical protein
VSEKSYGKFMAATFAADWLGPIAVVLGPLCPRLALAWLRVGNYPKQVELIDYRWTWAGVEMRARVLP